MQVTTDDEVTSASVCNGNLDNVAWVPAWPPTINTFTEPGPESRDLSFGGYRDWKDEWVGSRANAIRQYAYGTCCCIGNGFVDPSVPDVTNDQLCHGKTYAPPPGCRQSQMDCYQLIRFDHIPYSSWDVSRQREGGCVTFRAPRQYDTNTKVIFTFEGVDYRRRDGAPLDLRQVKFRGQPPISYSNETQSVSYWLTVDGGQEYTISEADFEWPADQEVDYNSSQARGFFNGDPSWQNDTTTTNFHWLTWTDFHNHVVPTVNITGPQDLYVFCNQPTPSYQFKATVTPSTAGTFEWSAYHNGAQHTGYLTIGPVSQPASTQPNYAYVQAVDTHHVSDNQGDTLVQVVFHPDDTTLPDVPTNFPVTVGKPWRVNQQPITYANYVVPPTNALDSVEASVTYTVYDQTCTDVASTHMVGFPATETVTGAGYCMIDQANNTVYAGGYIYDTQTWERLCGVFTVNQQIGCDCANIQYSITTAQDPTAMPPYPRWYLNYVEQPGSNTCPP